MSNLEAAVAARLRELAAKHDVVGASLAIHSPAGNAEAAYGVTNVRTGAPVTPDTVFQIGSITKVYTATLVMQLVDEGQLDLDRPVREYLPELRLADRDALTQITTRHLLAHTSGLDGDIFDDHGRGDDCVQRYVAALADVGQTSRPGELFSYCNAGWVILGRLIEVARGTVWDAAVQHHICSPLGLTDTVTLPEEAILRSVAVGHATYDPDRGVEPAKAWHLARAVGPAGAIVATAREVIRFAQAHLAPDSELLSAAQRAAMRTEQVRLPDPNLIAEAWGLGWILFDRGTPAVIGHDGSTMGQQAYLRIVPEADVAITLLTNGGNMGALAHDLLDELLGEQAGIRPRPALSPPSSPVPVDLHPFTGRYERAAVRFEITLDEDGELWLHSTPLGPLAALIPAEPAKRLVALDDRRLLTAEEDKRLGQHVLLAFVGDPTTGFTHLHTGARATPKLVR